MKNETTVGFKTHPLIAQLIEKEAEKRGMTKSDFLTKSIMDSVLPFEEKRTTSTLIDFLSIALPNIVSQGIDKEIVDEVVSILEKLQKVYCNERLEHVTKYHKRLTDQSIEAFLQGDNIIEEVGLNGFIVQQCLQTIYDKFLVNGLISEETHSENTQHYQLYMEQGEGAQLLKNLE